MLDPINKEEKNKPKMLLKSKIRGLIGGLCLAKTTEIELPKLIVSGIYVAW